MSRPFGARQTSALILGILLIGQLVAATLFATTSARKAQSLPLSVAIIGDSFASGDDNRVVWPTLLAARTGWSVSNFALPDAGFAADGRGGYAFTYQVDRALAAHPQIVVMAMGGADNGLADKQAVSVGAQDALTKLTLAGLRSFIVGPTWYREPVPPEVREVSKAVRQVAEKADVPFLDALDPPWLTEQLMQPDLDGASDAGQSVIADRVASWLRSEGVG